MSEAARRREPPSLALIVGPARSGTTLLRRLLDAHPEVGSPSEVSLAALTAHSERIWQIVCRDRLQSPTAELPPVARRAMRRHVTAIMQYYCDSSETHVFCDKSLDSHEYLAAVKRNFADVKVVIIVRHVMDTIASGIEASRWGFGAYGYAPYVRKAPENVVGALAAHWEATIGAVAEWEEAHPEDCYRVRYEDLVADPRATMAGVCGFLDVATDVDLAQRHFANQQPAFGPGDHKLEFTTQVMTDSVGRGKGVPVNAISPPLLERINDLLERFGYERVTRTWNSTPRANGNAETADVTRLHARMEAVVVNRTAWTLDLETFAIVADDEPTSRWIADKESNVLVNGDGDVDFILTGATADLLAFLDGRANVGEMLRAGRLRCMAPEEGSSDAYATASVVGGIARILMAERAATSGAYAYTDDSGHGSAA